MGNAVPKFLRRGKNGHKSRRTTNGNSNASSQPPYEELRLAQLRIQLTRAPQELVLDQLLLLLPFEVDREQQAALFAAAEGGDAALVQRASGAQVGIDTVAHLKKQERSLVCPDALATAVARVVAWSSPHGWDKKKQYELLPTRLYIVQTNVVVEERDDYKPYTRIPGAPVHYILRTDDGRRRADVVRSDNAVPRSHVGLYVVVEPSGDTSVTASAASSARPSGDIIGAAARSDESGAESADSTEDGGLSHEDEDGALGDGGQRSPKDPLPPIPTSNQSQGTSEASDTYWAGRPIQKPQTGLVFGPAYSEKSRPPAPSLRPTTTERRLSGMVPLTPSERKLSGLVPLHKSQKPIGMRRPPPLLLNSSSGGSSRSSLDTDYGYAGSTGSARDMRVSSRSGHSDRSDRSDNTLRVDAVLRDGEIPTGCFKGIALKPTELLTEEQGDGLFVHRRYLQSGKYEMVLGKPPGLSTPEECAVRLALPQLSWPTLIENQWVNRRRRIDSTMDPRTKRPYEWPTPEQVEKARSFGCVLVPSPERDKQMGSQWEYDFPASEAYLESILTGNQIRVLLSAAALLRASVSGATGVVGVAGAAALADGAWAQWLRHAFFWQCERNAHTMALWERPGAALMTLLDAFYEALERRHLKNFFMTGHNLLKHADHNHICVIQERLHRARENLLVHMLAAARSLVARGSVHRGVDVRQLHKIIIAEDFVTLLNPNLVQHMQGGVTEESNKKQRTEPWDVSSFSEADDKEARSEADSSAADADSEKRFKMHGSLEGTKDDQREWLRRFRKQIELERAANSMMESRASSLESIDLQVKPQRAEWESLRSRLVLDDLSAALGDRAEWLMQRSWLRLARVCARQAQRLALLLGETGEADPQRTRTLHRRALDVDRKCVEMRNNAQRSNSIEIRRTSFVRGPLSPAVLDKDSPVTLLGEENKATSRGGRSTFIFPLGGTANGESDTILEEEEETAVGDGDDAAASKRYSTIAEVHVEVASLQAKSLEVPGDTTLKQNETINCSSGSLKVVEKPSQTQKSTSINEESAAVTIAQVHLVPKSVSHEDLTQAKMDIDENEITEDEGEEEMENYDEDEEEKIKHKNEDEKEDDDNDEEEEDEDDLDTRC